MSFFEIFILSLVEGLTEFIPVSSTGHLIIANKLLNSQANEFTQAFDIIIQFGAILSVLVIYRNRFRFNLDFYKKLLIAFLPAAMIGFVFKNQIDHLLNSHIVVALALIVGGIVMILVDRLIQTPSPETTENLSLRKSFKIGLAQCLALVPGVSRSAATIIGGQLTGLDRKSAAEFSFFLAVPTLTAAALYKTWKIRHIIHSEHLMQLALGTFLSFIFAILAIKFFIRIVARYGFTWFGVYRIVLGTLVLLFMRA